MRHRSQRCLSRLRQRLALVRQESNARACPPNDRGNGLQAMKHKPSGLRRGTAMRLERSRFGSFEGQIAMDVRTDKRTLETMQTRNPRSTAQIAGHPLHPMLIPFPVAFFVGTFAADIVFMRTMDTGWAMATQWLLGAGLVMAALAALAGLTDFAGEHRIRKLNAAWLHAGANVLAVLISLYNFY